VWYFAWFGAPLAIVVNIIVSLLTKPTPLEIKKFLAEQVHN
jgi:predicted outer membrane lipoprotein